jgi:hypothetical protein
MKGLHIPAQIPITGKTSPPGANEVKDIPFYCHKESDFYTFNTIFRYEVPETSVSKSRIPDNKPNSDHYQPSPSYFEARTRAAPEDKEESKDSPKVKGNKPSENRQYSSYGERQSNKGKKGSSEDEADAEEDEADRSVSPSEFFFNSNRRSSEEDGSGEREGKPSEYSFSSSKQDPAKNYNYHTTDPPVSYYYEHNSVNQSKN